MMGFPQIFCLFLVAWLSKPATGLLETSNVAFGKPVTKADGSTESQLSRATDGVPTNDGNYIYMLGDNPNDNPAIVIDLLDDYYIEYVMVHNIQSQEQLGLWMIGNTTVEVQIEDGSYVKCGHIDEECPGSKCEEWEYYIPCGLITRRIQVAKYSPAFNQNDKVIFLTEVEAFGFAEEAHLDNLAAGMSVSAASGNEVGDVSLATDNVIDKLFENFATLARVEAPASEAEIVIDLGGLHHVEFVSIFTAQTNDSAYTIHGLDIYVENYFGNDVDCGVVGPTCAPQCYAYVYSVRCNLVGTKIKLVQDEQLSIQEVKAFGTTLVAGLENLALGKTVTALDGVVQEGRDLSNAVDGTIAPMNGPLDTNAEIEDENDVKVAFQIDLGVVSQIDHVIIHNVNSYEGFLRAMIGNATVSVGNSSTDAVQCGKIWDECRGSCPTCNVACYEEGYVVPCPAYGSKVIISQTEDPVSWLEDSRNLLLQEVEVYGIEMEENCRTYGITPECEFQCNCVNGEKCDLDTGYCENGCNNDGTFENMWLGSDCQTGNIGMKYVELNYLGVDYTDPPENSDPSLVMDRPAPFALDGFVQPTLNDFSRSACIEGLDAVFHIDLGKRYYIEYFEVFNLNTDDAEKLEWIRRIDVRVDDVMCGHVRHENNTMNYVLGAKDVTRLNCDMSGTEITLKHKPVSWVWDFLICLEEIVFVGRQLSQAEMADPVYMDSHIPNVALGKSISVTGEVGTNVVENAVDGIYGTLAHVIPAPSDSQARLIIHLGPDYNVYGIEVNNVNTPDLALRAELEGVVMHMYNSQPDNGHCHTFTHAEAVKKTWVGNCDGYTMRTINALLMRKNGQPGNPANLRVQEVKIFGYLKDGPEGDNIALGKTVAVIQKDYEDDEFPAVPVGDRTWEHLTDGFVDRSVDNFDSLCHYRAYDYLGWSNIYLIIDLGDYYDVKSIRIFNINTYSDAALNQMSYIDVSVEGEFCYDTGNTFFGYLHIDCDVPQAQEVKLFKRSVSASEHPGMERSYDQQIFHAQEIMVFGVGPVEGPSYDDPYWWLF